MAIDLVSELVMPGVEDHELAELILEHYGGGRRTPEGEVLFPGSGPYALKLRAKKSGIVAIEPGPGLSAEDIEALKNEIRTRLAESPGTSIERCVLFSSCPVRGCFRSPSRHLQILPPPATAPQVNVIVADHPFVVEFPIRKSVHLLTTLRRRNSHMLEWSWVLNAFLRPDIYCIGPEVRHLWVLCPDDTQATPTQTRVKWAQQFYTIDGFENHGEGFTESDSTPLALVDDSEYYGSEYYVQDELVLPKLLPDLLDVIVALSGEDRRCFLRAAQWMYAANAHCQHTSTYLVSLVAAIESLIPPSVASEQKCSSCKRDLGPGSTQRFQDFVEQHMARNAGEESNKKRLYRERSKLLHGWDLLQYDEAPWGSSMTTPGFKNTRHYSSFRRLSGLSS